MNNKLHAFETFRPFTSSDLVRLKRNKPFAFNGVVRVKRYRIIVEEIHEPKSIYLARLNELLKTETNHHIINDILRYAEYMGFKVATDDKGNFKIFEK